MQLTDHPLRDSAEAELHARPFPRISGSCLVAFLAVKIPAHTANSDRKLEKGHLNALLIHHGFDPITNSVGHYYQENGRLKIKYERHTEFSTFTILREYTGKRPAGSPMDAFPTDWLTGLDQLRVTSACLDVREVADINKVSVFDNPYCEFNSESLSVSSVLEGAALIMSDFVRKDDGHNYLTVIKGKSTGAQRTGRIVQRLLELESYRNMSFLALPKARSIGIDLSRIEGELTGLVAQIKGGQNRSQTLLDRLLDISAELEGLIATTDYRFSASRAYSAIVDQRVHVLRELHVGSRQTFEEFLMRRFAPAMRTCEATHVRLNALAARAARAADLLRTRVEVTQSQQNQAVLKSMDARANLQLRLQSTVEGLSVVAISYYAVSLLAGVLTPFGDMVGISKYMITALVTVPVVLVIWMAIRRIRARHSQPHG